MNGKQQTVAIVGVGLVLLNFWTTDARQIVTAGVFSNGDTARAHQELKVFAGELLFVALASIAAGFGDGWGTALVAAIVALAILWAMHRYTGKTSQGNVSTASRGVPA